jgi:hypothetical protein
MTAEPAVTITLGLKSSDDAFVITSILNQKLPLGKRDRLDEVLFHRPTLRNHLESILKLAGPKLELEWEQTNSVLKKLQLTGVDILLDAVGGEGKLEQVERLFREAFEASLADGSLPIVRIVAPPDDVLANTFPFELLPFPYSGELPRVENVSDLAEVMGTFLGFSAIVDRACFEKPPDLKLAVANDMEPPKLPIKLFVHAALPGVLDEAAFLKRRPDLIVDGPWPTGNVVDGPVIVARHISNPSSLLCGSRREPVDQVQHFSCHCDTTTTTGDHFFSLQSQGGNRIDIELSELPARRLWARRAKGFLECDMPLVLFNNCGGAAVDPKQIGSFVKFFSITNKNRGFIGTQSRVSDRLAEAFSKQFYINLLRRRQPVGLAVFEARRAVALVYNNPLSLFYIHYGSPWLRVSET